VPDLREGQYTRITVMLQGTLADIEQPTYVTVVQPVCMFALFPECLVAGLGKVEYLVPQPRPI